VGGKAHKGRLVQIFQRHYNFFMVLTSAASKPKCPLQPSQSVPGPAGVTSIGDFAFDYCSALTSVTIPASVTAIRNNAFSGTYRVAKLVLDKAAIGGGKFVVAGPGVKITYLIDQE
jgi:hypothetical protein